MNENIIDALKKDIEAGILPKIYIFDKDSKEFIEEKDAEKDPEESRLAGAFIPLKPVNATLIAPPAIGENEIAVYNTWFEDEIVTEKALNEDGIDVEIEKTIPVKKEAWDIKPDYRKNFVKVDDNLNVFGIDTIGEINGFYIVSKEIGEEIKQFPKKYIIENNNVIKNPNYETEQIAELKSKKHLENTQKAKQAVENGYVMFKNAEFETNAQTVGDLTATMLMLQAQQNNRHSEPESIFEGEESICHSEQSEESKDVSTKNITDPSVVSLPQDDNKVSHSENTVILSETKALNIDSSPAVQNDNITYTWLSKDDQSVELTLDDFITLGNLIAEFKNTVWNVKYTAFKTAIEQAQTFEELEDIEINYANTDI